MPKDTIKQSDQVANGPKMSDYGSTVLEKELLNKIGKTVRGVMTASSKARYSVESRDRDVRSDKSSVHVGKHEPVATGNGGKGERRGISAMPATRPSHCQPACTLPTRPSHCQPALHTANPPPHCQLALHTANPIAHGHPPAHCHRLAHCSLDLSC